VKKLFACLFFVTVALAFSQQNVSAQQKFALVIGNSKYTGISSLKNPRERAVSLQFVLDTMGEAGNELNMIVLDACRDNPFGWARGGSRGLTMVSAAPSGSIVMYATSANSTADDGTGSNGLFTGQLLNNLKTPGLSVRDVFDKTGADVLRVSGGKQHPELSIRYFGASSAYLGTKPAVATSQPAPAPQPAPVVQPTPAPKPAPAPISDPSGGSPAIAAVFLRPPLHRAYKQCLVSQFQP